MTVDETWFIIMSQRIKLEPSVSRTWVSEAKEVQDTTISGKVMATVFWDAKDVIILDFLPKRSTITGSYYANLLDQLRIAIREKRRGKLSKGVCCNRTTRGSTLAKLQ